MNRIEDIDCRIEAVEKQLAHIDEKRKVLLSQLVELKQQKETLISQAYSALTRPNGHRSVTNLSSESKKIALFRSLFRGREDVFARRFESANTVKSGYQPCCRNEWIQGICQKPKIKCTDCSNRDFVPVTDEIIRCHLLGIDSQKKSTRDFTIGIYPLLTDETCWFLGDM